MAAISVLINTLNEEKHIKDCLECVKWADEIVIVDMYSDDRTVEIAKRYTDKVFMHSRVGYVEPARQFGLNQVSNDWVLIVDADELVPPVLADKLKSLANSDTCDAVYIPHTNYFFGQRMSATGWGPLQDKHVRFFKKTVVEFSDRIHSPISVTTEARVLQITDAACSFIHFNYVDVEQFVNKMNRYTTIEAFNAFDRGEASTIGRSVMALCKEFIFRFFIWKGIRDGYQGFMLSVLMIAYRAMVLMKLRLMYKYGGAELESAITEEYKRIACETISEYNRGHEQPLEN